ncbi:2-hydroxyisoflavanone dehydratase-like [Henckelia pumila]|uniref:2-hydroxyisoflavanone dehydratase-like n=1 Tax=Henckelia pumila TaxID=405737 RepID=UPI003C6E1E07
MASPTKEILTDLSPILKHYTDGTVERMFVSPYIPPSPEDPNTGVSSKDIFSFPPDVSARIYLPKLTPESSVQKLPILVYFHGGGFCVGSAFSSLDHPYLNLLAAEAKALVITVEYRLAPEHPLPAAYEDSWNGLKWVCAHNTEETTPFDKEEWIVNHGDFTKLFVGGDSAGGNIAHYVAMRAGTEDLPEKSKILGALLSHPFFWGSTPVGNEPKENIEESLIYRIWVFVWPDADNGIDNPLINPIGDGGPSLSSLGCSRIMVCVAEKDVLTARAIAYAEKVKKSGWKGEVVEVVEIEGADHCFQVFDLQSDKAKDLIGRMASFISL